MAKNPIADWVMETLRDISAMPIKGIVLAATTNDGETYTNYYNVPMNDKLLLAGLINQDATLDMLAANGVVNYGDNEEDDEGEEEDEE